MKPTRSSLLQHIPGSDGLPVFGETFVFLRDAFHWSANGHQKFGPVFRTNMFLHGGSFDGSAGCIDVGGGRSGNANTNRLLNDLKADPDGKIPVLVK